MTELYRPTTEDLAFLPKIYRVNPTLHDWKYLLDDFCKLCNLQSFTIAIVRQDTFTMRFHVTGGKKFDDFYIKKLLEGFFRYDLCQQYALSRADQRFHATNLIDEISNEAHGIFFTDWCQPQGIQYGATCCLFNSAPWQVTLHSNRGLEHPAYTETDVARLEFFVDAYSVALTRTLEHQQASDFETQLATLNCFRIPVALFNSFGAVVAMNTAFERCLDQYSLLDMSNQVLSLNHPDLDKQLKIRQLRCLLREFGYSYGMDEGFVEGSELGNLRIGLLPLQSSNDDAKLRVEGGLIYLVEKSWLKPPFTTQLCSLFSLTVREAELCQILVQGLPPKVIAQSMDLSIWTVREYLSNIFRKTGSGNQLQLINILASLPSH